MDFRTMMALEPYADRPDAWTGIGPDYPWGGLYGGQIVAQALWAARGTVDPALHVHSLHASFLRRGSSDEKILFEVDRVRDGGSFANRRVVASQAVGVILTMSASFHVEEEDVAVQVARAPHVPDPGELASDQWAGMFDRRMVPAGRERGSLVGWMQVPGLAASDDRELHAAALAYLSDDLPTEAILLQHPETEPSWGWPEYQQRFFTASLDHAVWFHRPLRADEWHLHVFTCQRLSGSRGLSFGHVFDRESRHVATVSQEILLRSRR